MQSVEVAELSGVPDSFSTLFNFVKTSFALRACVQYCLKVDYIFLVFLIVEGGK